jgi:post-segregation antitoxin (ccd killing protein)
MHAGGQCPHACELELIEQIGGARAARWLSEIGEAITASHAYADQQALPLASSGLF